MIMQVMSIRDKAIHTFGRPMFVYSVGQAVRGFGDEVNRVAEGNQINAHPKDFDLYHLGTFDDQTGKFENAADPILVCNAESLRT